MSNYDFLTVGEVASALRISPMTVYRLVQSGELTAIRVGRSLRIDKQAFNHFLEKAKELPA